MSYDFAYGPVVRVEETEAFRNYRAALDGREVTPLVLFPAAIPRKVEVHRQRGLIEVFDEIVVPPCGVVLP